jgi:hypothetical protein
MLVANLFRKVLFMRCASDHAVRRHQDRSEYRSARVDLEEFPEQQYERTGTATMSHVLLIVLVAVVCFIAAMAAWTSA